MGWGEAVFTASFVAVALIVPWLVSGVPRAESTEEGLVRERRLWVGAVVAVLAIFVSLGFAAPLIRALREPGPLSFVAGAVVALGAITALTTWIRSRPDRRGVAVMIGLAVVYLTAMVRITNVAERTHLFEYGLVAILVHQALIQRRLNGRRAPPPAVTAVVVASAIGWLDEFVQWLLPGRVYDLRDVGFNGLAAVMGVGAAAAFGWVRASRQG
jgi:VanZ family protein